MVFGDSREAVCVVLKTTAVLRSNVNKERLSLFKMMCWRLMDECLILHTTKQQSFVSGLAFHLSHKVFSLTPGRSEVE